MKWYAMVIILLFLSGCSLAPKYQRPTVPMPATYKESGKWLQAKPDSAELERGPWWHMYHDPVLNALEDQVTTANQNIQAAVGRFQEARALVGVAESDQYPTVLGIFNSYRQQTSGNTANAPRVPLYSDLLLSANFNYELDVWGRVRNSVAAAKSLAQASAADLAAINLSMHAELAKDYFALRGEEAAERVLAKMVVAYEKALAITQKRYKGGIVPIYEVDQAKSQLDTARTKAADIHLKRAQLEHAIAVLIGQQPSEFTLKKVVVNTKPVVVAPYMPSTLLERRPDIAQAESFVQAANSNIGVARAAYFPAFNLSAGFGFESALLANLLRGPSEVWSLGPTVATSLLNNGSKPLMEQVMYDGGRIRSLSDQARAKYFEVVANYRQTVLTAFQEVEDSLVAVRQLEKESQTQTAASKAARKAWQQAEFRYQGGLTTYLNVVVAEDKALQTELATIDVHTRRQLASVQLIKALGGGWQATP